LTDIVLEKMSNKAVSKDEQAMNKHVEDLKERMRLLQADRKANIDVLESNKAANKEDIRKLREENKELRQKLAQLQRTSSMDDENDEKRHIEREVDKLRKGNDDLKVKSARQRKNLEDLRDAVKALELDSQRPHMEDNEYTRTIRGLENKLDRAMIKYNEAQSIRKTYEQIVRRLKEERVGFDNQLAAIERTLAAKQRDYEELLLLSGDANHARESALGELDRVRAGYEEERRRREKELRERHQVVQIRRQMLERMRQREKMRNDMAAHANEESAAAAELNNVNQKAIENERLETRNKIDIFENAFRKIKEATGVSDVNEVIQKILSQGGTTENLISLTRENQGKIESYNEIKRKLKVRVEEVKYAGVGGGHRRKMVDDHEDQLSNSITRLERSRTKYERFNKMVIAMKAGVGHLVDKLEPIRDEVGGKKIELSDETVAEVLRECELCLSNLVRRIRAGEDEKKKAKMTSFGKTTQELEEADALQAELELNQSRPFNQRIDLSLDDEDRLDFLPDDAAPEMDDEELTRDKVKRASTQILQAVDRKMRKPKKVKGKE
jgi:coiled-coil domain-containing protein 151